MTTNTLPTFQYEIEKILRSHPLIAECAVEADTVRGDDQSFVAFFSLNERLISEAERCDWEAERIHEWQLLYDDLYSELGSDAEAAPEFVGWRSSYSGEPIDDAQMRRWADNSAVRILSLRPRRALEVGCGTGLILSRVAPLCEGYMGTDISRPALEYARTIGAGNVELRLAAAHDSFRAGDDPVDTVILNSVVQYFPSVNYLVDVLSQAVSAIADRGHVFIGDVRSLPVLPLFHFSIELYLADPGTSAEELWTRTQRRSAREQELCVDPRLFAALMSLLPRIVHVQAMLKQGFERNELNSFRYDVVLTVENDPLPGQARRRSWCDWKEDRLTLAAVRDLLADAHPDRLGLARVPNARLSKLGELRHLVRNSRGAQTTVGCLTAQAEAQREQGVEPESLWRIADDAPYDVELSWLAGRADGSFEAVLNRRGVHHPGLATSNEHHLPFLSDAVAPNSVSFTNAALWRKACAEYLPRIEEYVRGQLPRDMLPPRYVIFPALPLTPSGDVDRATLHLLAAASASATRRGPFLAASPRGAKT